MARTPTTAPFYLLGLAVSFATIVSLVLMPDGAHRLEAVSLAAAVLAIWYGTRPSENWNRAMAEHVVLLKYPLIAYAVAPALPADGISLRSIALLGGLYAAVCVYAYVDDPELRHSFPSWRSIP